MGQNTLKQVLFLTVERFGQLLKGPDDLATYMFDKGASQMTQELSSMY
jgi:hypothetical protein